MCASVCVLCVDSSAHPGAPGASFDSRSAPRPFLLAHWSWNNPERLSHQPASLWRRVARTPRKAPWSHRARCWGESQEVALAPASAPGDLQACLAACLSASATAWGGGGAQVRGASRGGGSSSAGGREQMPSVWPLATVCPCPGAPVLSSQRLVRPCDGQHQQFLEPSHNFSEMPKVRKHSPLHPHLWSRRRLPRLQRGQDSN